MATGLLWCSCAKEPHDAPLPSSDEAAPETREQDARDEISGPTPEEERSHLAALGYVDFAEDSDVTEKGVLLFDRERSCPGYSLYTSLPHGLSVLMDELGREIKSWTLEDATRCVLLPDGDVLVVTSSDLIRLGWNGEERWRAEISAHHDVRWLATGEIAVLTYRHRAAPDFRESAPIIRDDEVTLLSSEGEVLETHSIWDMIASDPEHAQQAREHFASSVPNQGGTLFDVIHANSVDWFRSPDLARENPLYGPSNVLVSMRHQDSVAIFDVHEERIVWMWGSGELEGPHEARLLPSGNVLIFDNGHRRRHSRIVEVDPRNDRIVWEFAAAKRKEFFSRTRGTSQQLPNQNVLVASSNNGEAFEVDRGGRLVWRFLNPHTDEKGRRGTLRIARYAPAYVEAILELQGESPVSSGQSPTEK